MAVATWNGAVIAKSDQTVIVEGNHYFPADSVDASLLRDSSHQTTCGWKGTASYKTIEVDGQKNEDAVWYYPNPKPDASHIQNYFAFWKGVQVDGEAGTDQTPDGASCET
ncbi:MAG: DUF427 domain-containing protein [Planctomycetota bacterium]